jgi:hypothetical protein
VDVQSGIVRDQHHCQVANLLSLAKDESWQPFAGVTALTVV